MNANLLALLAVALGGALGGALRYVVASGVGQKFGHPVWGTLAVNVSGSFILGALAGALEPHVTAWLLFSVGLLGSYTTVSSFSLQTMRLIREGRMRFALSNIALSVALCLGSAAAGFTLGAGIFP